MRVCLVTTELLGVGATGGIGVGARVLGKHLVAHGVEVCAIVPRGQQLRDFRSRVDGILVITYERSDLRALTREIRGADADVYHSIQPSLGAFLAQRAMPDRAHVLECVDPRDWQDWWIDFWFPTHSALRLIPSFVYFGTRPAVLSARRADSLQVPAWCLQEKVKRLYGLNKSIHYLPMPVVPPDRLEKSPSPLVVFVGRFVPRKRAEVVLDLASRFPSVQFVLIGSGSDNRYTRGLRRRAAALANVTLTGFIDQAVDPRFFDCLSKAWVLINTSAREGLPLTFIEAAAHGCAILSACDPDEYASNFGYRVSEGNFVRGLEWLLANDRWRGAGEAAHLHVKKLHFPASVIRQQLAVYESALTCAAARGGMLCPKRLPAVEQ